LSIRFVDRFSSSVLPRPALWSAKFGDHSDDTSSDLGGGRLQRGDTNNNLGSRRRRPQTPITLPSAEVGSSLLHIFPSTVIGHETNNILHPQFISRHITTSSFLLRRISKSQKRCVRIFYVLSIIKFACLNILYTVCCCANIIFLHQFLTPKKG
jgi:hypothetical protein